MHLPTARESPRVIPAEAGIQYASAFVGETGSRRSRSQVRGPRVSFLRKQESRKKLDSHFRGNDIQGGLPGARAFGPQKEADAASALPASFSPEPSRRPEERGFIGHDKRGIL